MQTSDPTSTWDFEYDFLGRAWKSTQTIAGLAAAIEQVIALDVLGNRTILYTNVGTPHKTIDTYTYDNLNRVTIHKQQANGTGQVSAPKRVDFSYDAAGQLWKVARYRTTNGTLLVGTSEFTFDQAGRAMVATHLGPSANSISEYTRVFDKANRVTAFYSTTANEDATYSYDDAGQVTGADRTGTGGDESFAYDANGNRTSAAYGAANSTYTTNSNNRLGSDGTFNYTYDAEGNRLTRTRISGAAADDYLTEYSWDHRNRLTRVAFKNNAGTLKKAVDYTYDAQDRRVTKSLDSTGDGVVDRREFYAYDGANVTLDYVDTDGDVGGAGGAQPVVARRYLFGPAVDQVLAVEDVTVATSAATRVLWHLTDTQGTVRDLVNRTGVHTEHYHYDSFGKLLSVKDGAGNTITNPSTRYTYTGRELDTDTGLMYYRARWYDPAVGRFISEDPIPFIDGWNNYVYVHNAPTIYVDPTGLAVGHHFVTQETIKAFASKGYLTDEAIAIWKKAVTGATVPRHIFDTYGGIKHASYNKLVYKAACEYYDELLNAGKLLNGQLTGAHAQTFVDRILSNGAGYRDILKFNTAVLKQVRIANIAVKMGGGAVLFGAISQATQALAVVGSSTHFSNAVKALKEGDLDSASAEITPDDNSLYQELVDHGLAIAGLNMRKWWFAAVEHANTSREIIP